MEDYLMAGYPTGDYPMADCSMGDYPTVDYPTAYCPMGGYTKGGSQRPDVPDGTPVSAVRRHDRNLCASSRFGGFLLSISVISFRLSISFLFFFYYSTHRIQSLPHFCITDIQKHSFSASAFGTSILDEGLNFAFSHQCILATESKGVCTQETTLSFKYYGVTDDGVHQRKGAIQKHQFGFSQPKSFFRILSTLVLSSSPSTRALASWIWLDRLD